MAVPLVSNDTTRDLRTSPVRFTSTLARFELADSPAIRPDDRSWITLAEKNTLGSSGSNACESVPAEIFTLPTFRICVCTLADILHHRQETRNAIAGSTARGAAILWRKSSAYGRCRTGPPSAAQC